MRLLSPSDYGVIALGGMWVAPLALLSTLGTGEAIIQFPNLQQGELNACFWLTMSMAGLGYLAMWTSAPAIAAWFANPMLTDVLRVMGLTLPLMAVASVSNSLLRKRLELDKISQAEIIAALVSLPVTLILAWTGYGVWALVAGVLANLLVQDLVIVWFVRWWPGLRVTRGRLQKVLRYSLATVGSNVCWGFYQEADTFALGKVSGHLPLGFYAISKQLALVPVEKIGGVANQLAPPIMAKFQADRNAMRLSFLRGLRLMACLTVPLSIGMALVAEDFVRLVLTEKWLAVVPLLQLFCVHALVRPLEVLLSPVLFARYQATFLFRWTLGLLLVMPLVFWAGAGMLGPLGVVLGWVVAYPLMLWPMARRALRELQIGWKIVWDQVRPVFEAALIMATVVLLVLWTIPGSHLNERLVRFTVASGLGALVYGLGIFWRARLVAGEIADVAGWLLLRERLAS